LTNSDGSTSFRYLDPTNPDDVTVAWEVTGNSDANNRRIEKVLQVKTIPDKNDPNVSTITKTTFLRDNVINVTKNLFAAWLSRALDIKNIHLNILPKTEVIVFWVWKLFKIKIKMSLSKKLQ